MITKELFNSQPWAPRLLRRKNNFFEMLHHIEKFPTMDRIIVETGTAHDKDNFEGQGQSTLVWDWAATQMEVKVFSIDLRPEAIETASKQTKNVEYIQGDSVQELAELGEFAGRIGLLYLDSFDWTEELNFESAFHHIAELTSIWAALPKGCMIVVDDRHGDFRGKHWMVEAYMRKMGATIAFKNHQMGWIK